MLCYDSPIFGECAQQCFREALVWKQLDHPNVLPFLGVNEKLFAPSFCLISPWHSHGNLMVYLEKHPGHDRGVAVRTCGILNTTYFRFYRSGKSPTLCATSMNSIHQLYMQTFEV